MKWTWTQSASEEIFNKKYKFHRSSIEEVFNDVATVIASVEKKDIRQEIRDKFYDMMIGGRFIPAGRILANAWPGSKIKNYINCFTIGIQDDMDAIFTSLKEDAKISKVGGGVGFDVSPLRPRGTPLSVGGEASGPISFLRIFDASAKIIMTGGSRRAAHIALLDVTHPDIEEFITCKQGDKNRALSQFNISVKITDRFMKAVEEDLGWELSWGGKTYKTVKAKYLYDLMVKNAYEHNEPGIFNIDTVNRYNNGWWLYEIHECNPCLTGDTLIAVADGRNAISFKQLVEEAKDVPVYCKNNEGKTVIRMMRNPRITGYNHKILKINLDDGTSIRCTENHKLLLIDGSEKEAKDLQAGDSLSTTTKWKSTIEEINKKSNSHSSEYYVLHDGQKIVFEHRAIYEHYNDKIPRGLIIHHKDKNSLNNNILNLEMMTKEEHDKLHDISGDKNPMRYWWSKATQEERNRYHNNMSLATSGKKNGMFGKHQSDSSKLLIGQKSSKWHSDENNLTKLSDKVKFSHEEKAEEYQAGYHIRALNYLAECQNQTDLECAVVKNTVRVKKICETCGKDFWVKFRNREQSFCSHSCGLVYSRSQRNFSIQEPYKNHKVVSIEFYGYEDVYNGTVDEFHNIGLMLPMTDKTLTGRDKHCIIFTRQCGEQPIPKYNVCDLGAMNLTAYAMKPFSKEAYFDFERFSQDVQLAVRFLDNVLDAAEYPLEKIKEQVKNLRRIGLGFTGLGDTFAMLGVKYGDEQSKHLSEEIAKSLRDNSYTSSVNLAKEKNTFPLCDVEKLLQSKFIKKLPKAIKDGIAQYGLRNIALNTVAPTGTISFSIGLNCSSGIEPVFALEYKRRVRTKNDPDEYTEESVYDYAWGMWKVMYPSEKLPDSFVIAKDVSPKDSIDIQAIFQEYIDAAISKTLNLAPGTTFEQYKNLFRYAYEKGLKGFTTYNPEGSMKGILEYNEPMTNNNNGDEYIKRRFAPKRPLELECDIHQMTVNGKKTIVLVGKLKGSLYEIFVDDDSNGSIDIGKHKYGIIKKVNRGRYDLVARNGTDTVIVENLSKNFGGIYGSLARLVSMSLRHGTPLQFIVEQLTKSNEFVGFERSVSRVLKKYIKDGEKVMTGDACPECNGELEFREGCVACPSCAWSKCL